MKTRKHLSKISNNGDIESFSRGENLPDFTVPADPKKGRDTLEARGPGCKISTYLVALGTHRLGRRLKPARIETPPTNGQVSPSRSRAVILHEEQHAPTPRQSVLSIRRTGCSRSLVGEAGPK